MTYLPLTSQDRDEGIFPIPFLSKYYHVVLDPSQPELSDRQRSALLSNIQASRHPHLFNTGLKSFSSCGAMHWYSSPRQEVHVV